MNLSEDKMQKENNGSIFKQFGKTRLIYIKMTKKSKFLQNMKY